MIFRKETALLSFEYQAFFKCAYTVFRKKSSLGNFVIKFLDKLVKLVFFGKLSRLVFIDFPK